jgi:hypothetical protein
MEGEREEEEKKRRREKGRERREAASQAELNDLDDIRYDPNQWRHYQYITHEIIC